MGTTLSTLFCFMLFFTSFYVMEVVSYQHQSSFSYFLTLMWECQFSQVALVVKNPPANPGDASDMVWIPESGRYPGVENGNPLQFLAWKIPWVEEPGRLQSMGSQRVRHPWAHQGAMIYLTNSLPINIGTLFNLSDLELQWHIFIVSLCVHVQVYL